MHYISHRGNLYGPEPEKENKPYYIKEALANGYECEIDLWHTKEGFALGHDGPEIFTSEEFLKQEGLWIHCKDVESLQACLDWGLHCFYHRTDNAILTSKGYIWVYPGKSQTKHSIIVMPEHEYGDSLSLPDNVGICSDYIWRYKSNGVNS